MPLLKPISVGVSDHINLTSIGTNTHAQIDTHLALTSLNSHGSTATADINFATYKAVAMVTDGGATLPTSPAPVEGQLFRHTPTGRKVLMMYDGSAWVPLWNYAAATMYVDTASGSDNQDKGYGTGANAFATPQFAANQIGGTYSGNIIAYVATGSYTTGTTLSGKNATGAFTITFQGALPTADVTGTATSAAGWSMGAAGAGVVQPVLNDTSKSWTPSSLVKGASNRDYFCLTSHTSAAADQPESGANWRRYWSYAGSSSTGAVWASGTAYVAGQHANKLLIITGGTGVGQERVIDWNKSTQLRIVGVWVTTPDNTSTYAIYNLESGAKIDMNGVSDTSGGFSVKNNQSGVILKYFYIEDWHSTGFGIYGGNGAEFSVYSCKLFRDRTGSPASGYGAIHLEGGSRISHLESTVIVEAVATTCINSGIAMAGSMAPILGDNIKNIKIERCASGFNVFGGSVIAKSLGGTGSGWIIRNARAYGLQVANVGNVDIPQSIITCCAVNGIVCLIFGTVVLRPDMEISMSGGDGIQLDANSSLLRSGSGHQLNYNGGWGVNVINLSVGYGSTGLGYTGNVSGTYTADASSKNI